MGNNRKKYLVLTSKLWNYDQNVLKKAISKVKGVSLDSFFQYEADASFWRKGAQARHNIIKLFIKDNEYDAIVVFENDGFYSLFPKSGSQSLSRLYGEVIPFYVSNKKPIPCLLAYPPNFMKRKGDRNKMMREWVRQLSVLPEKFSFPEKVIPKIILCKSVTELKECANKLKEQEVAAFDFETSSLKPYKRNGKKQKLVSVAFAFDDGTCYSIPLDNFFPKNLNKSVNDLVRDFFYDLNPKQKKIAYSLKFDLSWGLFMVGDKLDRKPLGEFEDSMMLCYLNESKVDMLSLKSAAFRYLAAEDWDIGSKNISSMGWDVILRYNALDAFYTLRLYNYFKERLEGSVSWRLYKNLLIPVSLQFMKVEMRGVPINKKVFAEFYNFYEKKVKGLLLEVKNVRGDIGFNPQSPPDVQNYLKSKKYKLTKKTKTGFSTDESVLRNMVEKYEDPLCKKILEFRELNKLFTTSIVGVGREIEDDSRLHGNYKILGAITGRTSSTDPNMQNFPKRKNKQIREMVEAPKGYKICSFDYGQIEARLFAVLTGDKKYLDDLYNDYDIHMDKSIWIYHKKLGWSEEEAKAQRHKVKNRGVFPAFYGAGVETISKGLGIDEELAKKFKSSIFTRYKTIKKWQRELEEEEEENGSVGSLFGRRRRSPMGYNEMLNFPCQSAASDMTLSSMVFLGRRYQIGMMIHDDITFFLEDDDALADNIHFICEGMLSLPWLFIKDSLYLKSFAPMVVECEVGDNWADQKLVATISSGDLGLDSLYKTVKRGEEIKYILMGEGW